MKRSIRAQMAILVFALSASAADTVDLAGSWRFRRDDQKTGVTEKWFDAALPGGQTIKLPGTMDEGKLGVANPKAPDLADLYRPNVYEGVAWYETEIEIPEAWSGKRVILFLERCRWVTQVWLDGQPCGGPEDSLVTPHKHLLGVGLTPGRHRLTIRNDNTKQIDLGKFVSALYGGTPGNLNGIVGKIELRATSTVWIEDVHIYPDAAKKSARVKVRIGDATGKGGEGRVQGSVVRVQDRKSLATFNAPVSWPAAGGENTFEILLPGNTDAWDEFAPHLLDLSMALVTEPRTLLATPKPGEGGQPEPFLTRFGLRDFAARGTQFAINGRPLFLRGTLECQVFPLTGYPPCDVPSWQRIYKIIKSYGLNHMRFHSWCPPEAAFAAADIEGVYLQVEAAQANVNAGADARRDAFTEAELRRIVRAYGNHPSFCLLALGNEYGGKNEVLGRWVRMLQDEDPRHLYTSAANNPQMPAHRDFTVTPSGRGVHGPGTQHDLRAVVARDPHPVVGHEIGQWTFFPDFDEMKKYTGVMEPRNFALVREDLRKHGTLDQAKDFFRATGAQATLLYKEEMEVLLRTAGYAGFQLLDLHDYPSQGTALIGPLDPFWDSKGFITPERHRQYCEATVPLLRMSKRTYVAGEVFTGTVEVAHFGAADLRQVWARWSILDAEDREIASGKLESQDVPTGRLTELGGFQTPLAKARAPGKHSVVISLEGAAPATPELAPRNEWEIWVYPEEPAPAAPAGVVVARQWDGAAKAALADGKSVLLFPSKKNLSQSLPGKFLPVFWSPVWFPSQKPNTMGLLCDPKHPLFAQFPTEFHSNWQWWDLINNSSALILDGTPPEFRPTVQIIDNFVRNHKLGTVFEATVGPGRLLVCAIDIEKNLESRPAARQFARSLYGYVASKAFRPRQALDVGVLDQLFGTSSAGLAGRLGAKATADSANAGYPAENAIDGDPDTLWHSEWEPTPGPMPHHLVVEFPAAQKLAGIRYLPRQDMANGRIAEYAVFVSSDGTHWGDPVASGKWADGTKEQTVRFPKTVESRWLQLEGRSEVQGKPWTGVAELEVVTP